jgi:hypothetical protein
MPKLPFEYEYRFTEDEYEYEKNQWYELPSTIMPDGPVMSIRMVFGTRGDCLFSQLEQLHSPVVEHFGGQ